LKPGKQTAQGAIILAAIIYAANDVKQKS